MSEIGSGSNQISVNELNKRNKKGQSGMANFCRLIGSIFSCFQANNDDSNDFRVPAQQSRSARKSSTGEMGQRDAGDIEQGNLSAKK